MIIYYWEYHVNIMHVNIMSDLNTPSVSASRALSRATLTCPLGSGILAKPFYGRLRGCRPAPETLTN